MCLRAQCPRYRVVDLILIRATVSRSPCSAEPLEIKTGLKSHIDLLTSRTKSLPRGAVWIYQSVQSANSLSRWKPQNLTNTGEPYTRIVTPNVCCRPSTIRLVLSMLNRPRYSVSGTIFACPVLNVAFLRSSGWVCPWQPAETHPVTKSEKQVEKPPELI